MWSRYKSYWNPSASVRGQQRAELRPGFFCLWFEPMSGHPSQRVRQRSRGSLHFNQRLLALGNPTHSLQTWIHCIPCIPCILRLRLDSILQCLMLFACLVRQPRKPYWKRCEKQEIVGQKEAWSRHLANSVCFKASLWWVGCRLAFLFICLKRE